MKELSVDFLLKQVVPALAVFVVGYVISKIIVAGAKKLIKKSDNIDPMMHRFILKIIKIGLWVVVLFTSLNQLGVNMSSLITVFAACGAAVALALKDSLSNLAGGILIMFTRPFSRGDFISCNGMTGIVDSIDLLRTYIRTLDNQQISIPNGTLTANSITNSTRHDTRMLIVKIGVTYDSDTDKAKAALLALAERSGLFLAEPPMLCHISAYESSALVLEFRGHVNTPDYWPAHFHMQNGMKAALEEAGISIPLPRIDVYNKSEET
ncbi:MAG TPA: mechanosensitive ion channel family protein [Bacillota bacterium]|nr:mechanosensitive ion channel family protein [Bacillota bacterium]HQC35949.1 mechanosensitive ion channel family protein [Bacillota bacterium]